jgi:hypothetical protein
VFFIPPARFLLITARERRRKTPTTKQELYKLVTIS